MDKIFQYTCLSKDIINIVGKYLLPSKINKQNLYNKINFKDFFNTLIFKFYY